MRVLKISRDQLKKWLDELSGTVDLYVPMPAGKQVHRFEPYTTFEELDLSYTRTVLPPKKFVFPPEEVLFNRAPSGETTVPDLPARDLVLFGVHPCDINGIRILDTFFSSFDKPDWYYQRRRARLRIVGLSCLPDEHCFCRSMDCDSAASGFDLFFHDIDPENQDRGEKVFFVSLGTVEGDIMLADRADTLPEAEPEELEALLEYTERRESAYTLDLDPSILPQAIKLHQADPLWDRLGEQCLACGVCSLGCPTCTCFNIRDTNDLEGGSSRVRNWDACLYRDFARVAGDHNFRPHRSERIQNRYYHKQVGFAEAFGKPSCVGCGRCIKLCPTGIHFVEVFQSLARERLPVDE
ncbi:MAG: 4Fe-4S dicluster domain-containing protein [bacterium]|nr:4Fe-4S dicluster domain-containing protein [bacterium]MDT8395051.1 4Fe-4S dicluster domain-containing protein [bacterium]